MPNELAADIELPAQLILKAGLVLHERDGGSSHSVLEDTTDRKYFRLGPAEHLFVGRLMADHSVAAAALECARQSRVDPTFPTLTRLQIYQICRWLQSSGLCDASECIGTPASPGNSAARCVMASFYFLKLPLLNPDRALGYLVTRAGWLFSWQAAVIEVVICLAGCSVLIAKWSEFLSSYQNLMTAWNGLWLLLAWCGLKLLHETAHGGTCKRYGGEVPQAGLAFVLMFPIAFIDVTSSWRFRSRWQRLHVALAGVAVELGVAGLALFAWSCMESLPLKQAAANVVLLASVSSLLINLNPLLKFDGYFALSDLSGVDNLHSYGRAYARYFGARYLLGLDALLPSLPKHSLRWIKVYGIAAALWRTMTLLGLVIAASALFHGAGIVIAAAGVLTFLLQPLARLTGYLRSRHRTNRLKLWKLVARVGSLLMLSIAGLFVIPGDFGWTLPAIVEYDPPAILRAPADGFIESVSVINGQRVTAGQPVVALRNDELQLKLLNLQKQLAHVDQLLRSARWAADVSMVRTAESQAQGLMRQLTEAEHEASNLIIRAPVSGQVVSRQLATMLGTYMHKGDEIAAVGMEQRKRIKFSLSQWEASRSATWSKLPLRIIVPGQNSWQAQLSHLESHANLTPPDWSLCATHGGPLSVVQSDGGRHVLHEPRTNAYIQLAPEQSQQVSCGQRCFIRVNCPKLSLGHQLWQFLADPLSERLLPLW